MRIIVCANIIGLPLGCIVSELMLQGLPGVNMLWPIMLACIASVTLSLASVLWQTLRAARTNPAEALKKE
jgi:ABC-type lipoprotein release transport system permease subunit